MLAILPTRSEPLAVMNMELNFAIAKIERVHNTAIVTLKARLTELNAPLLMQDFNQLIEDGVRHFVVDLSAVREVSADGDYPLLHLLKRTYQVEGSVILVCPMGNYIRLYYEATHYDTLFDIVETLDMALAKLDVQMAGIH